MSRKLFIYSGADLYHDYSQQPISGWKFNVSHFMKEIGIPLWGTEGWNTIINTGKVQYAYHGVRPMSLRKFKVQARYEIGRRDIKECQDIIDRMMDTPVQLYDNLSRALVTASLATDENATKGRYSSTLPRGNQYRFHYQLEQKIIDAMVANGYGKKSQCSGKALKQNIDHLVDHIGRHRDKIGWPIFSVTDCNCFHNSAYIMGAYALDNAIRKGGVRGGVDCPVLAINIDQHTDLGTVGNKVQLINSDGWGAPLLMRYRRAAYVVLGDGGVHGGNQIHTCAKRVNTKGISGCYVGTEKFVGEGFLRRKKKVLEDEFIIKKTDFNLAKPALKNKLEATLNAVFNKVNANDPSAHDFFKYAFITVDRDCMKKNFTQWQDAKSIFDDSGKVLKMLDALLSVLKDNGCKLAGFDVTGLPECRGGTVHSSSTTAFSKIVKPLRDELRKYHEKFTEFAVR